MKKIILLFTVLIFLIGCSTDVNKKPGSSGATCEILLVCYEDDYQGALGDTLRAYFCQPQQGLNQPEQMFDLSSVTPGSFRAAEMFQHMRNIIQLDIRSGNELKFEIFPDLYALPQIVFSFSAPNREAFYTLFNEKKELMKGAFYAKERERIIRSYRTVRDVSVQDKMDKYLGFNVVVPEGFKLATLKSNFAWIRKEAKDFSQGILVYTYPYTDANTFTQEAILAKRDEMTRQFIPGPTEGSYMTTEKAFHPIRKEVNFKGRYAVETRGLWRLDGDFMGGPYVNYVFLDEANNRVVMIDGFLYAPNKVKRNLLLQLEGIAYSYQEAKKDSIQP